MTSKYVWVWSSDRTVIYVYEVYIPRFRRSHSLKLVKLFYTKDFTDVQAVAEDFVDRLEKAS